MNHKILAQAALEKPSAIIDAAKGAARSLTADEAREISALEDEARSHVEKGEREAEVRALATGIPALSPAEARTTGTRSDIWVPTMSEYRALQAEHRVITETGNPYIKQGQANVYWDRLRAKSVVLAANPLVVDVEDASFRIPTISTSVSVATNAEAATIPLSEAATIPLSEATFSQVLLNFRKFAALSQASSEVLADSQPDLARVLQDDMIKQTATAIDTQFLTGNGTAPNVRGFTNFTGIQTQVVGGANGGVPTLDDYAAAIQRLESANADLSRAVFFVHPRSFGTLRTLKDANGRYQLNYQPGSSTAASLFGVKVLSTTNLPVNVTVGTSTDCSPVILADMSQVVVGRRQDVEVKMSEDFAFDKDVVTLRVIARTDIAPINAQAVVRMDGVRA
jgi:HK97 family phage major capsid protein